MNTYNNYIFIVFSLKTFLFIYFKYLLNNVLNYNGVYWFYLLIYNSIFYFN